MKQKNLILMVVAVGCGLVAAFLTSQMGAKPKTQDVPMVDVIVATKELTPGTRFTKDSLKDQVKSKKYRADEVPNNAVVNADELVDKQLAKTLRADDYVSSTDLGSYQPLQPPSGKDLITIRLPVDKVTPFVKAGSRVDMIGTGVTKSQKVVGMMILPNILIMAVDLEVRAPNEAGTGRMNIQVTTLALSTEEALLVRMCETANIQLSFILRSDESGNVNTANWSRDKVVKWVEDMQGDNGMGLKDDGGASRPKAADGQKVLLPVPTEDLPAGTEITFDLIKTKFKDAEFVAPAPEAAVVKMDEHLGKFLTEKVFANQFVSKACIGNKPEPKKEPTPQVAEDKPKEPKKETFDRTITNGSASKLYRFEKQTDGTWKLLGEVKEDGSVVPVQGNAIPAKPDSPPQGAGTDPKVTT